MNFVRDGWFDLPEIVFTIYKPGCRFEMLMLLDVFSEIPRNSFFPVKSIISQSELPELSVRSIKSAAGFGEISTLHISV